MSLGVAFHFHTEEAPSWPELLGGALRQLAAFPAGATLRSLRWSYVELNPGDPEGVLSVSLPQLLPNFFVDARARLGAVQRATLLGQLDLGYGEISGLVDACPHLQALTIEDCPVARHALAPLARLPLRSLTLTDVDIPGDAHRAGSYECLTPLRSLTRLDVGPLPGDLLPQLSGLPSLLNLRLTLSNLHRELDLRHLRHLTQLTSLSLSSYDPLGPNLALPPTLVLLHLPHTSLGSDAIELISRLPRLSELLAKELAPDRDFSHAVCSFTQLSLRFCSSPLQFTYLPLGSVTRLCLGSHLSAGPRPQRRCELDWRLDATQGLPDTCATLTRACEILARAMMLNGIHEDDEVRLQLTLCWKPAPPATSVQVLQVLGALAPLSELCRRPSAFRLVLGDGFQVSSEHVDRLASVLPNLSSLQVIDSMLFSAPPGFSSFAAALGTHMPRLRSFGACQGDEIALDIMPREIEDALLAMAALRARAGTPLTIYVGPGTSEQQLERWNSLMAVIRRDAGQMQQNQVLFQGMPHSDGW